MSAYKHQRIFWLDDNPGLIGRLAEAAVTRGLPTADDLLSRVTFAYDFEEGGQVVSSGDFDLYILDADFPDQLTGGRRSYIESFMGQARSGSAPWGSFITDYGAQIGDNFVPFYLQHLCGHGYAGKIIVYSSSSIAIAETHALGLPFYSKILRAAEVPNVLSAFSESSGRPLSAKNWEHGGMEELIERYILP